MKFAFWVHGSGHCFAGGGGDSGFIPVNSTRGKQAYAWIAFYIDFYIKKFFNGSIPDSSRAGHDRYPNEYSLMMLLVAEEHEIMHMSSKLMRVQSN